MKRTKMFQRLIMILLVGINLTLLLLNYHIEPQEIILCNLSLGLLYVAVRSALDHVRSNGLQEQLDEQI
jgi:hypothetical protein